jgi:Sulfotransferase family
LGVWVCVCVCAWNETKNEQLNDSKGRTRCTSVLLLLLLLLFRFGKKRPEEEEGATLSPICCCNYERTMRAAGTGGSGKVLGLTAVLLLVVFFYAYNDATTTMIANSGSSSSSSSSRNSDRTKDNDDDATKTTTTTTTAAARRGISGLFLALFHAMTTSTSTTRNDDGSNSILRLRTSTTTPGKEGEDAADEQEQQQKLAEKREIIKIVPLQVPNDNDDDRYSHDDSIYRPYEVERWPGYEIPHYAKKRYNVASNVNVCFVHVGKTAGSTVGCTLGFQLHCDDNDSSNNSNGSTTTNYSSNYHAPPSVEEVGLLPLVTTHTFHNNVNDCFEGRSGSDSDSGNADSASTTTDDDDGGDNGNSTRNSKKNNSNATRTDYYLIVVRNPLERIKSAYPYDRDWHDRSYAHAHLLYDECPFHTLNDLAARGLDRRRNRDNKNGTAVCQERAYNAIRGYERFGFHLYFNYRHYVHNVHALRHATSSGRGGSKILILRTEHLVDDWNSAEAALGGNYTARSFPRDNRNKKAADDLYLSDRSRHLLCVHLCNEMSLYAELLQHGINLTPQQRQQSMEELHSSCPEYETACQNSSSKNNNKNNGGGGGRRKP